MQLPPNPSAENLKKQAKSLLKHHRAKDPEVADYVVRHLPRLADTSSKDVFATKLTLQEAQLIVAREYGFPSWPKLFAEVERRMVSGEGEGPEIPFTDEVKQTLQLAREEASRLGHNYIGTEHILLGVVAEGSGKVAAILVRISEQSGHLFRSESGHFLAAAETGGRHVPK